MTEKERERQREKEKESCWQEWSNLKKNLNYYATLKEALEACREFENMWEKK